MILTIKLSLSSFLSNPFTHSLKENHLSNFWLELDNDMENSCGVFFVFFNFSIANFVNFSLVGLAGATYLRGVFRTLPLTYKMELLAKMINS